MIRRRPVSVAQREAELLLVPVCQRLCGLGASSDVEALALVAAAAESMLDHYVRLARANGSSWAQLGRELGVTRSAVCQKYGQPAKRSSSGQDSALF